jgi:hypothetical protein
MQHAVIYPSSTPATSITGDIDLKNLRQALQAGDCIAINNIKKTLSSSRLALLCEKLFFDPSHRWPDDSDKVQAVLSLVEDLDVDMRARIFNAEDSSFGGVNLVSYTVTNSDYRGRPDGWLDIASEIKKSVCFDADHHHWLAQLSQQSQAILATPVHYAARLKTANFLNLFSTGLTSGEWMQALSIRNNIHNTAVHTHFAYRASRSDEQNRACIVALRGPLTEEEWVGFLVTHHVLNDLQQRGLKEADYQHLTYGINNPQLIQRLSETTPVCQ